MLNKNDELIVEIIDNGFQGEGIAKKEDKTIFIPETIKGEKVKIKILKIKENIAFAKALEILVKSPNRAENDCKYYGKCGGCDFRHFDYKYSLEIKKNSAKETLRKALGREIKIKEIIGMDEPFFYRNKLQYPISVDKDGKTIMGIYAKRSHRIIEVEKCKIQDLKCQEIANDILFFLVKNKISRI